MQTKSPVRQSDAAPTAAAESLETDNAVAGGVGAFAIPQGQTLTHNDAHARTHAQAPHSTNDTQMRAQETRTHARNATLNSAQTDAHAQTVDAKPEEDDAETAGGAKTKAMVRRKLWAKRNAAKKAKAAALPKTPKRTPPKPAKSATPKGSGKRETSPTKTRHVSPKPAGKSAAKRAIIFDPFEFTDSDAETRFELARRHGETGSATGSGADGGKLPEVPDEEEDLPLAHLVQQRLPSAAMLTSGTAASQATPKTPRKTPAKKSGSAKAKLNVAGTPSPASSQRLEGAVSKATGSAGTRVKIPQTPKSKGVRRSPKSPTVAQGNNIEHCAAEPAQEDDQEPRAKSRNPQGKTVKRRLLPPASLPEVLQPEVKTPEVRKKPGRKRVRKDAGADMSRDGLAVHTPQDGVTQPVVMETADTPQQTVKGKQRKMTRKTMAVQEQKNIGLTEIRQLKTVGKDVMKRAKKSRGKNLETAAKALKRKALRGGKEREPVKRRRVKREPEQRAPVDPPPRKPILSSKDMLDILEGVKNETKMHRKKRGKRGRRLVSTQSSEGGATAATTQPAPPAEEHKHGASPENSPMPKSPAGKKVTKTKKLGLTPAKRRKMEKKSRDEKVVPPPSSSIDDVIEWVARGNANDVKVSTATAASSAEKLTLKRIAGRKPKGGATTKSKMAVAKPKTPPLKVKIKLKGKGRLQGHLSVAKQPEISERKLSLRKPAPVKHSAPLRKGTRQRKTAQTGNQPAPEVAVVKETEKPEVAVKKPRGRPPAGKLKASVNKPGVKAVEAPEEAAAPESVDVRRNPKIKTTDEVKKHMKKAARTKTSPVAAAMLNREDDKFKLSLSPNKDERLTKLIASVAKALHMEVSHFRVLLPVFVQTPVISGCNFRFAGTQSVCWNRRTSAFRTRQFFL